MAIRPKAQVTPHPAATPEGALRHFAGKLAFETDPSDLHHDQVHGLPGLTVIDARSLDAFADRRLPGAVPFRSLGPAEREALRGRTVVVYCWSASCNGATKACARLAEAGVLAKEMIGGIAAWVEEGYPTEGELPAEVPFGELLRYHHAAPAGPLARRLAATGLSGT